MGRRKFWSTVWGVLQVLLMIGTMVGVSAAIYLFAQSRIHDRNRR